MTQTNIFDICERKSRGHRNSQRANRVAQKSAPSMRQRLLAELETVAREYWAKKEA